MYVHVHATRAAVPFRAGWIGKRGPSRNIASMHYIRHRACWLAQVDSFALVLRHLLSDASRPRHVVDFGCGSGSLLLPLAHAFPHCHFTGEAGLQGGRAGRRLPLPLHLLDMNMAC